MGDDEDVRRSACEALTALGREAVRASASDLLKRLGVGVEEEDDDGDVRAAACAALGGLGKEASPEQVAPIAACLHDDDSDVCIAALETMGLLGVAASEFVSDVTACLCHPDPKVTLAASRALDCINRTDLDALVFSPR